MRKLCRASLCLLGTRSFDATERFGKELGFGHKMKDIPVLTGNPRPVSREDAWRCTYKLSERMENVIRDILTKEKWSEIEIQRELDQIFERKERGSRASLNTWTTVEEFQRTPWYRRYKPADDTAAKYISYELMKLLEENLIPPSLREDPYAHLRKRHMEDNWMNDRFSEEKARSITREKLAVQTIGMPQYGSITRKKYLEFEKEYKKMNGSNIRVNEVYLAWLSSIDDKKVLDRRLPMTEDDDVDWERLNKNMRDVEERRYKEWENYQKSHRNMEDQQNCAFIDLSIDNALAGRFELTLFESQVPNTVQHFRSLLSGTMGVDEERGIKLDYYGTSVRSIDKEKGIIVLGDFGSLGISVKPIPDENFSVRHGERGLLTMMSSGPNTGSTAFGILLKPAPSLDYTQVVFGKITDGFSLLERLETLPVNNIGKPLNAVSIALCGVLSGKAPRHGDGN